MAATPLQRRQVTILDTPCENVLQIGQSRLDIWALQVLALAKLLGYLDKPKDTETPLNIEASMAAIVLVRGVEGRSRVRLVGV